MRRLDRDHRGYPIPYLVWRDKHGRPHFTINDEGRRLEALTRDLCSICGQPLGGARWFTGGPRSAFDENGCYTDPPTHEQCLHYAMVACPYMASPNWARRIDAKTVKPEDREDTRIFMDNSMIPDRPVLFVAVLCRKHTWWMTHNVIYTAPKRPYLRVEYWQHGRLLSDREGERVSAEIMGTPIPNLRMPRLR
jgi:hypothetical protein